MSKEFTPFDFMNAVSEFKKDIIRESDNPDMAEKEYDSYAYVISRVSSLTPWDSHKGTSQAVTCPRCRIRLYQMRYTSNHAIFGWKVFHARAMWRY